MTNKSIKPSSKPHVIIRDVGMYSYGKTVFQLCTNCLHEHEGQNICYENGTCQCNNGNGKDLGYFSGWSDEFKELLNNVIVVKELQSI